MSSNHHHPTTSECVGSLILPSSDLQELSAAKNDATECVGSLLVHSCDIQELSSSNNNSDAASSMLPTVNLRQRVTAGTLLVKPDDLRSETHEEHRATTNNSGGISLQKRLSNTLTGPAPADDEADTWAD